MRSLRMELRSYWMKVALNPVSVLEPFWPPSSPQGGPPPRGQQAALDTRLSEPAGVNMGPSRPSKRGRPPHETLQGRLCFLLPGTFLLEKLPSVVRRGLSTPAPATAVSSVSTCGSSLGPWNTFLEDSLASWHRLPVPWTLLPFKNPPSPTRWARKPPENPGIFLSPLASGSWGVMHGDLLSTHPWKLRNSQGMHASLDKGRWVVPVSPEKSSEMHFRLLLFSRSVMSNSLRPHGLQHARLPCPSESPSACSNSCSLSQWWNPTISSSVLPFSSHLQSFPASGGLLMSWLFTSGGQSIGASASALVLSMNIQGWFPLGLTGLISLQSKGLSRVFNTTVQKHQFFGAQPSLWSNSHIHTWLLEKPHLWLDGPLLAK